MGLQIIFNNCSLGKFAKFLSSCKVEKLSSLPKLVSDLSDSLTSLIFGEQPERFAHISHKK